MRIVRSLFFYVYIRVGSVGRRKGTCGETDADREGQRRGSGGPLVVGAPDRKSDCGRGGDGGRNSGREGERVLAGRERVKAPRKDQGPRQT